MGSSGPRLKVAPRHASHRRPGCPSIPSWRCASDSRPHRLSARRPPGSPRAAPRAERSFSSVPPPNDLAAQCQQIRRRPAPLQDWTTQSRPAADLSAHDSCRLCRSASHGGSRWKEHGRFANGMALPSRSAASTGGLYVTHQLPIELSASRCMRDSCNRISLGEGRG